MLLKIVFFRFLNLILFVSIFCASRIFAIAHESEFISLRKPCRIEVVERGTNYPVSLVEFRTTHQQRFVTDNAGVIALDSPELIGRETWFDI
ncbi:MAG: hypothetical protein LBB88_03540, partial [Planctomycetaceae bacterium]|nr:hypothetical protein [Planctomycetaceae bacterium]